MEIQAPGAVFVTADKDSIRVARSAGIGQPVRPFAFVGGVIKTMAHVREFWEFTCYRRDCVQAGVWKDECVAALECSNFNAVAADRSPINPKILEAADALRWMLEDTETLVTVLESRSE